MRKLNILFLGFLFLISFLHAQENESDTISLKEIVVTGSKIPKSSGNVTQKIDIISKIDMEQMVAGNRNIADVLMHKPGASVSTLSRNDANWGTYGGIGPKYSTYMLQGLPVDAFMDPMALDLNAVERVEIQRGPASVLYPNYLSQDFAGNQSPLAGTVNLILKENIEKTSTKILTSYGSYNTLNNQAYHENRLGKTGFFSGYSFEKSDYTNYGSTGSWLNIQDDPEYVKTKLYGGINYSIGTDERQKVSLFINHTAHKGDAGRLYRGYNHSYDHINAAYSLVISNNMLLNARIGLRAYKRNGQESKFNTMDTLLSTNGNNQLIIPVDLSLTFKQGKNGNLVAGIDYQSADYANWSDPLLGYKTYGTKSKAMQQGIYVQEEYNFGNLTIREGLRFSFVKNEIDLLNGNLPGQTEKSWTSLLWSSGLKYKISQKAEIFANAGNSFMTPGLKAVGGTIKASDVNDTTINGQLPNPDLKPESGLAVDFGTNLWLGNTFSISVRGFYISVTNAIIDKRVSEKPSRSQSVNAGGATSSGAEFELKYRLDNDLTAFINATYFNTRLRNEINTDQDGANVPFAPEFVANAGFQFNSNFGFHFNPYINYNNGYYDSDSKSGRKKFIPGLLLNLFASQELVKKQDYRLDLFGSFYNITNNRYEMPWQFQDPGFSMMLGLKVEF